MDVQQKLSEIETYLHDADHALSTGDVNRVTREVHLALGRVKELIALLPWVQKNG